MTRLLLPLVLLLISTTLFAQPDQWQSLVIADETAHATSIGAGDFDNDGDLDIVLANGGGHLRWYEHPGDLSEPWLEHPISDYDFSENGTAVGDFDGDGDQDLAGGTDSLVVFLNDQAMFTQHMLSPSETGQAMAADVNGDGVLDILAYERGTGITAHSWDGTEWVEQVIAVLPDIPWPGLSFDTIDWNDDGLLDVVYGTSSFADEPGHSVALQQPDGSWQVDHLTDLTTRVTQVADLDLDGDIDIAVQMGGTYWYENTPQGFIEHELTSSGSGHPCIAIADVDFNGLPDILSASTVPLRLFSQTSPGEFVMYELPEAPYTASLVTGDFNNDGFIDVAGTEDFLWTLQLWINAGVDPAAEVTLFPAAELPYEVQPGDELVFDAAVSHYLPNAMSGYLWSEAVLPGGGTLGPLAVLPVTWQGTAYRQYPGLTQLVPAMAPPGMYQFRVNLGPTLNQVHSSDQFDVLVVEP